MFSTPVFAAAAGAAQQQPGIFDGLVMFLPIILLFWFLVLRPQNKKMKEHREMVNNVRRGDTVVTAGGIVGKVAKVKDDNEIEVDIAENVRIRVVKGTLSDVRTKGEPAKTEEK